MSIEIKEDEIVFNAEIDPHKAHGDQFPDGTTEEAKERWFWVSCGLIPRFFLQGYENLRKGGIIALNQSIRGEEVKAKELSLDNLANEMDELYHFGGFGSYLMDGKLTNDGVYQYPEDEETGERSEDFYPLIILEQGEFQCLIFESGVTAIRKKDQLDVYKVARFD